jgi:predicted nuclease of predicted toxin-antitoxin system
MRVLTDESCDFAVVRALRSAGHEVIAVSECRQRSVDEELMEMAYRDGRILVTEDKDFGWLAFVAHRNNPGVILIRFPATSRPELPSSIIQLVNEHETELKGAFAVLRPGSVRISSVPMTD